MATRKRYTQEEEQIIAEEVSLHQNCVRRGLLIASERLGRSLNSVQSHWYNIQSKRAIRPNDMNNEKVTTPNIFSKILKWLGL